ncbi:M56 family metallopeptidase [Brevibacillus sp. AG]|uniref:M56 family metallopeptidase n=1 Tax=Brevibacillus sp. AG TaxID=3020891 RepID=UPI00232AD929|nr:M56 family metallopeptidase [Brevibacillus sp. AG]MDC0759308.1 M56 family metallopeptidase [Brevibacillus sp. AG]
MDILGSIFLWMCYASLGASLVAILLVAIKKGVSQAISWRMHHLLWFIVLARLMIPVLPESSFSLFTWVFWASNSMSAAQPLSFSAEPQLMPNTQLPVVISEVSHGLKDNEKNQIQTEAAKDEGMNAVSSHPVYIQVLTAVWLVGVVFLLARLFAYLYKMHNKVRFLMRVTDERVFSIMDDCRKKFGVKRKIHVYTGTLAKGPLISGLFSPWVYCPRDVYQSLSDAELYHVFSHELAHLDKHKRTIHLTFENPEKPKTIVLFAQIKDKSIVENMRKTKKVPFERIDGAKFEVPVTSLNISGQEVFRTAPYKVDDTLSSPKDKDNHTYFWLKEDVCLKVTFKEVEADVQKQLVAALVKEKAIDLKK